MCVCFLKYSSVKLFLTPLVTCSWLTDLWEQYRLLLQLLSSSALSPPLILDSEDKELEEIEGRKGKEPTKYTK